MKRETGKEKRVGKAKRIGKAKRMGKRKGHMAEMSRVVALPLALILTVAAAGLSGCGNMAEEPGDAASSEISQNVPESRGGEAAPAGTKSEAGAAAVTDFGLRLLRQCMTDSGASLETSGQSQKEQQKSQEQQEPQEQQKQQKSQEQQEPQEQQKQQIGRAHV